MALRKISGPGQLQEYVRSYGLKEKDFVRKPDGSIYFDESKLPLQSQAGLVGSDLDVATNRYNQGQLAPYQVEDALKGFLGGVSPQFNQNRDQLLAQFSDPKSALFISNPFIRQRALDASQEAQKSTYGQILGRVQNLVGMGNARQGQVVQGLQGRLGGINDAIEAEAKARQQEFENQLALAKFQLDKSRALNDTNKLGYKVTYGKDPITGAVTGIQFTGKDGLPLTAAQYSIGTGTPISNILGISPDVGDKTKLENFQILLGDVTSGQKSAEDALGELQSLHPETFGNIDLDDFLRMSEGVTPITIQAVPQAPQQPSAPVTGTPQGGGFLQGFNQFFEGNPTQRGTATYPTSSLRR